MVAQKSSSARYSTATMPAGLRSASRPCSSMTGIQSPVTRPPSLSMRHTPCCPVYPWHRRLNAFPTTPARAETSAPRSSPGALTPGVPNVQLTCQWRPRRPVWPRGVTPGLHWNRGGARKITNGAQASSGGAPRAAERPPVPADCQSIAAGLTRRRPSPDALVERGQQPLHVRLVVVGVERDADAAVPAPDQDAARGQRPLQRLRVGPGEADVGAARLLGLRRQQVEAP